MFFRERPETLKPQRLYGFIAVRSERYEVKGMCRMLCVSESGYYRFMRRRARARKADGVLEKLLEVLGEHPDNSNYGVRRMHTALRQRGEEASYSTVYRVMKENGLVKRKRKPKGITKGDPLAQKSENLIRRDFRADAPNAKWLTDITQVPCMDGKLYIAPIMDCFDGKIVGLAMENHMKKELCIAALDNACRSQNATGMILHSDRGSQFTSAAYRERLLHYGIRQSMSGAGCCYDNARMESFFATLKKEKLYPIHTERMTREEVKTVIFRYVMVYYNRQRIYTANPNGLPPEVYRACCMNAQCVA